MSHSDFQVVLAADDGYEYRPTCGALLARLCPPLFNAERDRPLPVAMFNRKWNEVESAADDALTAFQNFSALPRSTSQEKRTLLQAHRQFLYQAAELIEDFQTHYRSCLWSGDLKSRPTLSLNKSLRDHVVVQVNRMKHNHAQMGYIEVTYSLFKVPGYVILNHVDEDTIGADLVVHKERQAFSFAVELRKVLVNLYALGSQVASYLEANAKLDPAPPSNSNGARLALLNRFASLPTRTFPSETERHMPLLRCEGDKVLMNPRGGLVTHPQQQVTVTQEHTGDGVTHSFRLLKV